MCLHFKNNSPCSSCPYRKDAKLKLWDKSEYEKLIESNSNVMSPIYACHKNNGSGCTGWLMMQDNNRLPNINLRIQLSKHNITREYLDNLSCSSEMYETTEEMIKANYPEL